MHKKDYLNLLKTVRKKRKKSQNLEHKMQCSYFEWLQHKYPAAYSLTYAIPNAGKRTALNGKFMKDEGLKSGVPDIHMAVPLGGYHGLYIELKIGSNKLTENQMTWFANLTEAGYFCSVCYSIDELIDCTEKYLK